jgi:multidrug resistance efflux pump
MTTEDTRMAEQRSGRLRSMLSTGRGKRLFGIIILLVLIALAAGVNLWYQGYKYVSTDNARIAAPLIPVTVLASCQVISLDVDYGSYVEKGQRLATVGQPRPSNPADRQGFRDIPVGKANIESPVSGYVAAVWTYPGALVSPGQPIVTVYDIADTWVTANILETDLYRLRPGQPVEIKIDSLGGTVFNGRVEGIAAATAASFSLLPQNNTTGNFTKVVQVVPVKISLENSGRSLLVPGVSVEVKIATR